MEQLHGGDINSAYCLYTSTGKYFLKVNDEDKYPGMFVKEANGLDLLRKNCSLIIPAVIKAGACDMQQFLLMEWLEQGTPQKNTWENFGAGLASMHRRPQQYFGLNEDNYIGALLQNNTMNKEWNSFFAECRVMPLVKKLFDAGDFSIMDINVANAFCDKVKNIFPAEPPALLHGDLWAGNYLIASTGEPAIFDPAVHFGHREMEIGMTKLFGGFDPRFYNAYNETFPMEKGWEKRLPITQLYPLLVHAVLFGGHYIAATRNTFKTFS